VSTTPALVFERIGKRFGDVVALHGASLVVRTGSVHALLGENGAGKTTLMRIAYGMTPPDTGTLLIDGHRTRLASPADAIARGIGMVHQHFTLVPAMTVAENIALGGRGRFSVADVAERLRALADATGLEIDPMTPVSDLSISAQQRLELLKALSRDARVLILDEPTAVLAPSEADDLLRQVRRLADDGRAVVLITHKLREALRVADDITVLRRGTTTLSATRADVDEDRLVAAMLGQHTNLAAPPLPPIAPGSVTIAARQISVADARGTVRVHDATFDVRAGEVVGVAGVEGAGHHELLRAVARRAPIASGSLDLPHTVGFVPDDRHRDGLIMEMTLVENFALKGVGSRKGRVPWSQMGEATKEIIAHFDVRASGESARARALSGGNQQKFVLGRELYDLPPALVIENPSRGLDVKATSYVRQRVVEARSHGVAIMAYSSDIEELLGIADRMLVVYGGSVREVARDRDAVGRAMLGAA
jgi:general nucleoside transport system ATP-binding protein